MKKSFFGKKHTNAFKENQRKIQTGRKHPMASIKISEKWKNEDGVYRKLMASDDYRQKMSKVTQDHWNSPESDNHRIINSEKLKSIRKDYDEKLRAIQKTDDYRRKLSSSVKQCWDLLSNEDKNKRLEKQLNSLFKDGNSLRSKGEIKLFELLKIHYPNIRNNVWIHKSKTNHNSSWNIDIHIPEIDTYIQFDGVYWHGLDRSIDTILSSSTKRNKTIAKKYFIDKEQNTWFENNNLKLIRITDIEFSENPELVVKRIVEDAA